MSGKTESPGIRGGGPAGVEEEEDGYKRFRPNSLRVVDAGGVAQLLAPSVGSSLSMAAAPFALSLTRRKQRRR